MEITPEQFATIEHCLPRQRGNVSLSNLQVVNAILFVAEHGCKWRGLPKRFGNWHTIYTRMNRWTKAGVLDRMFEELQRAQVVRIRIEAVSLDSTSIKVHPDGTGALKKRSAVHRKVPRRMEHQDSYGCRGCSSIATACFDRPISSRLFRIDASEASCLSKSTCTRPDAETSASIIPGFFPKVSATVRARLLWLIPVICHRTCPYRSLI